MSVLVNEMFNRLDSGAMLRVYQLTGQEVASLIRGYLATRDVFALPAVWPEIDRLDLATRAEVQSLMLTEIRFLVERASRWFLRHRHVVDPATEVARLRPGVSKLTDCLLDVLPPAARARLEARIARLADAGAPAELARDVCVLRRISTALDLVEAAHEVDTDLSWFAEVFFGIGEQLELDWLGRQAMYQDADSHWQMLAKTSLADELWSLQRQTATAILADGVDVPPPEAIRAWLDRNQRRLEIYRTTLGQLHLAPEVDLAMLSVAVEGLRTLLYAAGETTARCVVRHGPEPSMLADPRVR